MRFQKPRPRWKAGRRWRALTIVLTVPTSSVNDTSAPLGITLEANTKTNRRELQPKITTVSKESIFFSKVLNGDRLLSMNGIPIDYSRPDGVKACFHAAWTSTKSTTSTSTTSEKNEKSESGEIKTRRIVIEMKRLIDVALPISKNALNSTLRRCQEKQRIEREGVPSICQNGCEPVIESTINLKGVVSPPKKTESQQYTTVVCRSHTIHYPQLLASTNNSNNTNNTNNMSLNPGNASSTAMSWYYEATVMSPGSMQVGWVAAPGFASRVHLSAPVGDCSSSWSLDGFVRAVWHNGVRKDWGHRWNIGSVIGTRLTLNWEKKEGDETISSSSISSSSTSSTSSSTSSTSSFSAFSSSNTNRRLRLRIEYWLNGKRMGLNKKDLGKPDVNWCYFLCPF